ncbi:MAG: DUF4168 domain-containing protein [Cyanobacteria bacterium J06598_1]
MVIQNSHLKSTGRKQCSRIAWLACSVGALTLTQLSVGLTTSQVPAAYAQSVTDSDVANYAQAVFDIEAKRLAAYEAASDILAAADSELSILDVPLSCTNNRLRDMPEIPRPDRVDLRTILVTFCNEASQVAEENDLTPQRFNDITAAHQDDPEIAARIQDAISAL